MKGFSLLFVLCLAQIAFAQEKISLGKVRNGLLNLPIQSLVKKLSAQPKTRVFELDWTYDWGKSTVFSRARYDRALQSVTFEQHGQLGDFLLQKHFVVAPISETDLQKAALWPNSQSQSLVLDAYFESLESAFGAKIREIVPTSREISLNFPPTQIEGLQLEMALAQDKTPRIGAPLALRFRLTNNSDASKKVTVGGSCQSVHAASFAVITPENALSQNNNGGLVGGPHCFCNQKQEDLAAGATVELQNLTENSQSVRTFWPESAGKYIVVGFYALPDGKRLISQPLEFFLAPSNE